MGHYTIPQIRLDEKKDAETIKLLEDLLSKSDFDTVMQLVRKMVRVFTPSLMNDPVFNNQIAALERTKKSSEPLLQKAYEVSEKEEPDLIQTKQDLDNWEY